MTAFLLTWKESGWPYGNIKAMAAQFEQNFFVDEPWRFKAHKQGKIGDRVWLLRQGNGPKIIFGTGVLTAAPFHSSDYGKTVAPIRFDRFVETLQYASEIIGLLAKQRDLKLRTLEKVMTVLSLALAYTKKGNMRITPIVAGLCVMKVLSPSLFSKAQRGQLTFSDAEKFFDLQNHAGTDSWPTEFFLKWWKYALQEPLDENEFKDFGQALFNYNINSRKDIVTYTANNVIDRFTKGSA